MLFIDTETTGVTWNDEILSIAIIDSTGAVLVDSYLTPVRNRSWKEAERINGITPKFIFDGDYPTAEEVADQVADIIQGEQLCIYNAAFDMPMMERGFNLDKPKNIVHCCMNRFAIYKGIRSSKSYHTTGYLTHKLTVAADETGHKWTGKAHGALADAKACKHVWDWLNVQERKGVNARTTVKNPLGIG